MSDIPPECHDKFAEILSRISDIDRKLFHDNGHFSIQSKINANTQKIKLLTGVFTVIGTFILGVLSFFIKKHLGG